MNCSFEATNVPTGGKRWQFTDKIDGWSSTKGWFERWYGHDNFVSDNGGAHLELDVDGDEAGKVKNTTIWQVIDTQANRRYNVVFAAAHRLKKAGDGAWSEVGVFLDFGGSNTPAFGNAAFTTGPVANSNNYQWTDYGFSFTAGPGTKTTIGFRALGTPNEYGDHLDNIAVTAVPEPNTLALVGAGLSALAVTARRRRRA